ncbi:hypothetical protein OHA18_25895 [Kribbella sp. NBC_00709]|uniref:hypothetical protein n=1 Tax=Kribbella sp. NBC_00709 TaxID=2975972 RepID=UPI002E2A2AAE|nr:hypothetical protein [Kribbella sp. NBC_00709]
MTETGSRIQTLPDGVYKDGERPWRAKKGATSTFEEHVAARRLFMELHRDEFWNPWRLEEQAAELERAQQIMGEWERAEPGFRRQTKRQIEAEMARWDRDSKVRAEERERSRVVNRERYDQVRAEARFELLEQQCILQHKRTEVAALRSGERYPAMDSKRRADQVAELDTAIVRHRIAVERLTPVVGDPEDVPDEYGRLPGDRRHLTHCWYQERRIAEVRQLREKVPELEVQINATSDRSQRSKIRTERDIKKWRLEKLLAVPRQEIEDMCADCALPTRHHGYVSPPYDWPCPAWPGQRAIHARVMKLLETARHSETHLTSPPVPKPEPLAIVPSGLPIAEVVQRLQELQEQFPDAEVRRGRANRWELWPNAATREP